jgi:hypothetical protein
MVEAFRRKLHAPEGNCLRDALAEWAAAAVPALAEASPDFPAGVEDRNADIWEALLAIAEAARGDWPERARVAAVALVAASRGESPSLGVKLLADLREMFGTEDQLPTERILEKLHMLEESPWGDFRGKPLDARKLSSILRPYEVRPTTIRTESGTPKGYRRADFEDAWSRYLGTPPNRSATCATSATGKRWSVSLNATSTAPA